MIFPRMSDYISTLKFFIYIDEDQQEKMMSILLQ
jgi:hypothetical protein